MTTIHLHETESTNLYMRKIADAGNLPSFSIVWTDYQTKGRGQAGNFWESAPGKNLLCSFLLYPIDLPVNQSFTVLEITALSVKATLDRYVPDISIKWPNDIYYRDKKIGGILIENKITAGRIIRSIIGIGINLNQTEFQSDAPNPVSLAMITGCTCEPQAVLNQLHTDFKQLAGEFEAGHSDSLHQKYSASLYRRNGYFLYKDATGTFDACIQTIEPSGHLILKRHDGTHSRYDYKEVQYL